jgi:hypothetical protein
MGVKVTFPPTVSGSRVVDNFTQCDVASGLPWCVSPLKVRHRST